MPSRTGPLIRRHIKRALLLSVDLQDETTVQ